MFYNQKRMKMRGILLSIALLFSASAFSGTLSVSNRTPITATLNWTADAGDTAYTIWRLQTGTYGQIFMPYLNNYAGNTLDITKTNGAPWLDTYYVVGTQRSNTLAVTFPLAAGTVFTLPDSRVSVTPNYSGNTTIVSVAGVSYRGPSQFVYLSECVKPDSATYRCDIKTESNVVLVATDGSTVVVNLTVQFASTFSSTSTSGRSYWRSSQIVLSGDVTVQ